MAEFKSSKKANYSRDSTSWLNLAVEPLGRHPSKAQKSLLGKLDLDLIK